MRLVFHLQNVNSTVAQDWVSGLQRLILKKEEEIRAADRCRIQLQLPGKQDKSESDTHFLLSFSFLVLFSPVGLFPAANHLPPSDPHLLSRH